MKMTWLTKKEQTPFDELLLQIEKEESFWHNNIARILIVLALVPLVWSALVLGARVFPTDIPVVLRYNVYFGVSLLGDWWQVYMLPVCGVILLGLHIFLAEHYYRMKERVASYLLLLASVFINASILVIAVALGMINF